MVPIIRPEWDAIEQFLRSLPLDQQLIVRRHVEPYVMEWKGYIAIHPDIYDFNSEKLIAQWVVNDWMGKPCPFLYEDHCMIFPARPIECRIFVSLKPCTSPKSGFAVENFNEEYRLSSEILFGEYGLMSPPSEPYLPIPLPVLLARSRWYKGII
jgi:Fe-S-cluster containining protein